MVKEFLKLVGAIAVCQGAGIIGAIFTTPGILGWYANLAKPAFSPPDWVFGPVWITLYTLMGVSLYLVWRHRTKEECHCAALSLFFFQLGLNALWSYLFFGLREPLLALIEVAILFAAILLVIWQFWRISKTAAYFLLPYALWVAFATLLNYSIWQLN